jgi:hypothetical protein
MIRKAIFQAVVNIKPYTMTPCIVDAIIRYNNKNKYFCNINLKF